MNKIFKTISFILLIAIGCFFISLDSGKLNIVGFLGYMLINASLMSMIIEFCVKAVLRRENDE